MVGMGRGQKRELDMEWNPEGGYYTVYAPPLEFNVECSPSSAGFHAYGYRQFMYRVGDGCFRETSPI